MNYFLLCKKLLSESNYAAFIGSNQSKYPLKHQRKKLLVPAKKIKNLLQQFAKEYYSNLKFISKDFRRKQKTFRSFQAYGLAALINYCYVLIELHEKDELLLELSSRLYLKRLPNTGVQSQSIKEDMLYLSAEYCEYQGIKWQPRKPKQHCNNCKHAQPVHNRILMCLRVTIKMKIGKFLILV